MSFSSLGLMECFVRAVADQGYTEPTPIQAKTIPVVLDGRDVLATAQTGTGKTAAFALPVLQRLHIRHQESAPKTARALRALILTPTRELAAQVHDSFRVYGRHSAARSTAIFGGVGMQGQIDALRRGVDILVATPGRLQDHVNRKTIHLSGIEILVLDEADRLLDMGFMPAIRRILGLLPKHRQNLLFSATLPVEIAKLANELLRTPAAIDVAPRNTPAARVEQLAHRVDKNGKPALLVHLLNSGAERQALVFTRTKHGADRLARRLEQDGVEAVALHGNKSQSARTRALAQFKQGKVRVLVATDIASRGLDIDQLPLVVNYELPNAPEDYIHRIGRTGRAGHAGTAISLVASDEMAQLKAIQRVLGRNIPMMAVEGFTPPAAERSERMAEVTRPPQVARKSHAHRARSTTQRAAATPAHRHRAHQHTDRREAEPRKSRYPSSQALGD